MERLGREDNLRSITQPTYNYDEGRGRMVAILEHMTALADPTRVFRRATDAGHPIGRPRTRG